jgi:hypothetical protein
MQIMFFSYFNPEELRKNNFFRFIGVFDVFFAGYTNFICNVAE